MAEQLTDANVPVPHAVHARHVGACIALHVTANWPAPHTLTQVRQGLLPLQLLNVLPFEGHGPHVTSVVARVVVEVAAVGVWPAGHSVAYEHVVLPTVALNVPVGQASHVVEDDDVDGCRPAWHWQYWLLVEAE